MTLQDFLAASQGDERLAMARWIASTASQSQSPQMWATVPADILEGVAFPSLFILVDAVLAELARQREAAYRKGLFEHPVMTIGPPKPMPKL